MDEIVLFDQLAVRNDGRYTALARSQNLMFRYFLFLKNGNELS